MSHVTQREQSGPQDRARGALQLLGRECGEFRINPRYLGVPMEPPHQTALRVSHAASRSPTVGSSASNYQHYAVFTFGGALILEARDAESIVFMLTLSLTASKRCF